MTSTQLNSNHITDKIAQQDKIHQCFRTESVSHAGTVLNEHSKVKVKQPVSQSAVYYNNKPMITLIALVPALILILNMCSQKWNNFAHFYLLGGYYVLKDKITSQRCRNLGKLSPHIIIYRNRFVQVNNEFKVEQLPC